MRLAQHRRALRGAEPGDGLCVEIQRIELAEKGFLAVKAGEGLLGHMAPNFATRIVEIRGDTVHFDEEIHFPTHPMVGVIGTAPEGEGVGTGLAGTHGGNMDNKYITEGSKVYLPVRVPGALLGLGDVHGAMGDGEITFTGDPLPPTVMKAPRLEDLDMSQYAQAGFGVGVVTKLSMLGAPPPNPTRDDEDWPLVRPIQEVVEEVQDLGRRLGSPNVFFVSNGFNVPLDHAKSFCQAKSSRRLSAYSVVRATLRIPLRRN